MQKRIDTNLIVIHCSATQNKSSITSKQIRDYHVKHNGWSDIGYHFVILTDGKVELGREESLVGAHSENYNAKSLGICMIGGVDKNNIPKNNFTEEQFNSLKDLLVKLLESYPRVERICGHRDLPKVAKACPSFEVKDYLKEVGLEKYIK